MTNNLRRPITPPLFIFSLPLPLSSNHIFSTLHRSQRCRCRRHSATPSTLHSYSRSPPHPSLFYAIFWQFSMWTALKVEEIWYNENCNTGVDREWGTWLSLGSFLFMGSIGLVKPLFLYEFSCCYVKLDIDMNGSSTEVLNLDRVSSYRRWFMVKVLLFFSV